MARLRGFKFATTLTLFLRNLELALCFKSSLHSYHMADAEVQAVREERQHKARARKRQRLQRQDARRYFDDETDDEATHLPNESLHSSRQLSQQNTHPPRLSPDLDIESGCVPSDDQPANDQDSPGYTQSRFEDEQIPSSAASDEDSPEDSDEDEDFDAILQELETEMDDESLVAGSMDEGQ